MLPVAAGHTSAGSGRLRQVGDDRQLLVLDLDGVKLFRHCLACGHRGELDPRALAVVEGESTTMGAIERRLR
jgi:hypothetical protein